MVTQIENGMRVSGHEIAIFTRASLCSRFVMRIVNYPTYSGETGRRALAKNNGTATA
jgi:hypothetical protein